MSPRTKLTLSLLGLMLLALAGRLYFSYRSQPQLPPSPEVFQTVDALFTAVTAHDSQRLADCQQRLATYKDRGSLPPAAAQCLDRIISVAQSGDWTAAAHRLYDFMQAQKRNGQAIPPRPQLTAHESSLSRMAWRKSLCT
jgi:hypothetical protein